MPCTRLLRRIALLAAPALLAVASPAQSTWVQRTPVNSPSARHAHAMAYDWQRNRTVMFGGQANSVDFADTWEWDGNDWVETTPAVSPPARHRHAMAYDVLRQRVVMFGGAAGGRELGDTWEYDGVAWIQRSPATVPPARFNHGMVFDLARGRTVMVSGRYQNWQLHSDTWEWDGTNWIDVTTPGTPPGREAWPVYDLGRARTVLFGGGIQTGQLDDTWEWDGQRWWARTPRTLPLPRTAHAAAYDPGAARTVMFGGATGGIGYHGDTWQWDGNDWSLLQPVASPSPRWFHAMAFDLARQSVVLFGGDSNGLVNDTWEFGDFALASYAVLGTGCGAAARGWQAPRLTNLGTPVLGQSFAIAVGNLPATPLPVFLVAGGAVSNSNTWPLPPPFTGLAPACSLLVTPDLVDLVGVAAGSASATIAVPNAQQLLGLVVFQQFCAFDPTGPAPVLIATGVGAATVGDV